MTEAERTPLGKYITELCKRQNLSMREASRRADLGVETIGTIVRRGQTTQPRPSTLRAIADGLGGSYLHMMRLAGHLPEEPDKARMIEANEIAEQIASLPDGTTRKEAIAFIRAILESAHRRAMEQNE